MVWEPDRAQHRPSGLLSPVALFKLCLQVADPISCPRVFLLQQIQAIDHWWARWVGKDRTHELGLRPPGALQGAALAQHTVGEADGSHRAPSPSTEICRLSSHPESGLADCRAISRMKWLSFREVEGLHQGCGVKGPR